jgi:hypothetical protein
VALVLRNADTKGLSGNAILLATARAASADCFYAPLWTASPHYGTIPHIPLDYLPGCGGKKMHVLPRAVVVALVWCAIADSWVVAAEEKPTTTSVIKSLRVGDRCRIGTEERIAWNRRATGLFWGTLKSRSGDEITLANVATTGRSEQVTIFSRIPYVNRMFKNVGIGRSQLAEDDVVIRVKDISSARVIGEDELQAAIAEAKDHQFARVGIDFP